MARQPSSLDKVVAAALEQGARLLVVGRTAYLEGHVSSFRCKKELARLVADLSDVDKVVNRLRVVPGTPRSDASIREAIAAALVADPALWGHEVSVTVSEGVVEMEGAVPDVRARVAAEEAAWCVCGVRHVCNRLDVTSRDSPAEIGTQLRLGILAILGRGGESVKLEFSKGTVYLRGEVVSAEDRLAAEDRVRWHPLVRNVVNDLTIAEERSLSSLRQSA